MFKFIRIEVRQVNPSTRYSTTAKIQKSFVVVGTHFLKIFLNTGYPLAGTKFDRGTAVDFGVFAWRVEKWGCGDGLCEVPHFEVFARLLCGEK